MDEQFMDFHQFSFMVNAATKKLLFSSGGLPEVSGSELNAFAKSFCHEEDFAESNVNYEGAPVTAVLRETQVNYYVKNNEGLPMQVVLHSSPVVVEDEAQPHLFYTVRLKTDEGELLKEEMQELFKSEYESFVHTAAHDLDSPVRKITVLLERLLARVHNPEDEHIKQYSDRITHSAQELKSLIDGLSMLSLCILENRKSSECDLGWVAQQVIKDLNELIVKKNATVYFNELPSLQGDIVQYRQLFRCMLENAIKFCKETVPPVIQIEHDILTDDEKQVHHLSTQKQYHRITISDNGIGFHPNHSERIFKPFERLNGKSRFPGSGLGLTICKRIVENHNGIIFADTYSTGGCRITLILPQTQD